MSRITIEDISRIQRNQAWERAKGELRSVLCTYYSPGNSSEGQFEEFKTAMTEFIEKVESEGLQE